MAILYYNLDSSSLNDIVMHSTCIRHAEMKLLVDFSCACTQAKVRSRKSVIIKVELYPYTLIIVMTEFKSQVAYLNTVISLHFRCQYC